MVVGINGQTKTFRRNVNETVKEFKQAICNYWGILDAGISIVHRGKMMEENLPLSKYGLHQYE